MFISLSFVIVGFGAGAQKNEYILPIFFKWISLHSILSLSEPVIQNN